MPHPKTPMHRTGMGHSKSPVGSRSGDSEGDNVGPNTRRPPAPSAGPNAHHAGDGGGGPVDGTPRRQQIPNQVPFKEVGDPRQQAHSYSDGGARSGGQGMERSKSY